MEEPKLVCGLEVHQQLDTGKLFCECASRLVEGKPDFLVKRKLKAAASELGEFDAAAIEAVKKGYAYVYEVFRDSNCLVELDEEPPHNINQKALDTALAVCALAKASVYRQAFVMRKTVVDGSNTSGFQRTMLLSNGGELKTEKGKKIGIQTIALEEDACRPTKKDEQNKEIYYRLDRLGIPLIELATEPCITSPEEAKEAALAIGEIFRITCRAKRGLGTIRQDLNISIQGGARIEIKGCQDLELIDEYVRREVKRQKKLLELKKELGKRKVSAGGLELDAVDVSKVFKDSGCKIASKRQVFAARIPKFAGLLGFEVQQGKRFGSELAAYVKARAGLPGLFHSDELPAYGISEGEKQRVAKAVGAGKGDGFAIVICSGEKAEKAFEAIGDRCAAALEGVPKETRNALKDGNTEYSRPLPGAARMYPETDVPAISIGGDKILKISQSLPLNRKQRLELYHKKLGLSKQLAEKMALDNFACFFEQMVKKGHSATATAVILLEKLTELRRKKGVSEDWFYSKVSQGIIEEALEKLKSGEVAKEGFLAYVNARAFGGKTETKSTGAGEKEIREIIQKIVAKNKKIVQEKGERAMKTLMGKCMKELKGKADGRAVAKILQEEIKKS